MRGNSRALHWLPVFICVTLLLAMPQQFQAVKCYKCNNFQVQQVKKVQKFNCAICGEKQTIQHVYAISDAAKDIRHHVQRLNIGSAQAQAAEEEAAFQRFEDGGINGPNEGFESLIQPKKLTCDWGAFADEDGGNDEGGEADGDCEGLVTVLPDGSWKRARGGAHGGRGSRPNKQRRTAEEGFNGTRKSHDGEPGPHDVTSMPRAPMRGGFHGSRPQPNQQAGARGYSGSRGPHGGGHPVPAAPTFQPRGFQPHQRSGTLTGGPSPSSAGLTCGAQGAGGPAQPHPHHPQQPQHLNPPRPAPLHHEHPPKLPSAPRTGLAATDRPAGYANVTGVQGPFSAAAFGSSDRCGGPLTKAAAGAGGQRFGALPAGAAPAGPYGLATGSGSRWDGEPPLLQHDRPGAVAQHGMASSQHGVHLPSWPHPGAARPSLAGPDPSGTAGARQHTGAATAPSASSPQQQPAAAAWTAMPPRVSARGGGAGLPPQAKAAAGAGRWGDFFDEDAGDDWGTGHGDGPDEEGFVTCL